jgi:tetratricopeptide (TPR) repeat protein
LAYRAGAPAEDYRRALRYARAAAHLRPDDGNFLTMLGVAEYRAGQYQEALAPLTKVYRMIHVDGKIRPQSGMLVVVAPTDLAFLAMTQCQLGREEEARVHLRELLDLIEDFKDRGWSESEFVRPFVQEAETLLQEAAEPGESQSRSAEPETDSPDE